MFHVVSNSLEHSNRSTWQPSFLRLTALALARPSARPQVQSNSGPPAGKPGKKQQWQVWSTWHCCAPLHLLSFFSLSCLPRFRSRPVFSWNRRVPHSFGALCRLGGLAAQPANGYPALGLHSSVSSCFHFLILVIVLLLVFLPLLLSSSGSRHLRSSLSERLTYSQD